MSWICKKCETENSDRVIICEVCDTPREASPLDRLKEKYCEAAYMYFIRNNINLLDSADKGNAISQFRVGEWFYGRQNSYSSIDEHNKIAVFWYRKAAMQGHGEAQYKLANCYLQGHGVSKSKSEAKKWFNKAAEQGNYLASQEYIKLKYSDDVYKKVIIYRPQLLIMADKGDNQSQLSLANWFSKHSKGNPKYKKAAFSWYMKAANQGNHDAMFQLGSCYENGNGVERDFLEAANWYKRAANKGSAPACQKLFFFYLDGCICLVKNTVEAKKWLAKFESMADGSDLCNLGCIFDAGNGTRVDKTMAVRLYKKASEKGNATAQYNLGVCYENGTGVGQDINMAKYWYEKAAAQGSSKAQQCLLKINTEIREREKNENIVLSIVNIIIGSFLGAVGYYGVLEALPKWGIYVPDTWPNTFPTNLIACIIIGVIAAFCFNKE